MNVVKRNGKYENYNCKKIKKAIAFACDGLDVNPLELEAKFDEILYDGVFPCGLVSSLADVCNTCVMLIGNLLPPKYSGLCCLASGDDTPKYDLIISVYLVPFLASRSNTLCIAKASLNVFTDAAVAFARSAYNVPFGLMIILSFAVSLVPNEPVYLFASVAGVVIPNSGVPVCITSLCVNCLCPFCVP